MNWFRITNGVQQIWEDRPDVIALLALGFVVFIFIVLDARRSRRRDKSRHPRKY